MIKQNLTPTTKFVDYIKESKTHGVLRIIISVYDEPIASTDEVDIHSVIDIREEKDGEYFAFGHELYPTKLSDENIKEAFKNIKANPEKFRKK